MSVISVAVGDGEGGNTASLTMDRTRTSSIRRRYWVDTDDPLDQVIAVLNGFLAFEGLAIGAPYLYRIGYPQAEQDPNLFLDSVSVDATDDPCRWSVEAVWSSQEPPRTESPLDEPIEIDGGSAQYERPFDKDRDGAAIVNSAKDSYDPPVMGDDSRHVFRVTRNEPTFPIAMLDEYRDTTNDALWFGFAAGTAKMATIRYQRLWHRACGYYWRCTYEFNVAREGWAKVVLDQGFYTLTAGTRKQVLIDGQPPSSPKLLDGSGALLGTAATPVFRTHHIYAQKDFRAFGFEGS